MLPSSRCRRGDFVKRFDEFVDPDCRKAYIDLVQLRDAFRNAVRDLSGGADRPTILFLDYSIVYPLVTPRDNIAPTPATNKQDYAALQFLSHIAQYKHISGLVPVYSPFLIIELFDQLKHRQAFFELILASRTPRDFMNALKAGLPRIPTDPSELEAALQQYIHGMRNTRLTERLSTFIHLIKTGIIRNILELVPPDQFMKCFDNTVLMDEIYDDIDRFRRPSTSPDPADREFHKLIDVFIVTFIKSMKRHMNSPIVFVGPDRLRRIFGREIDELSRDILSPFIIVKALSEAPSDRNLYDEARANIQHRADRIDRIMDDLYAMRAQKKIPFAIVKDVFRDEMSIKEFLYGDFRMETQEQYRQILNKIAESIPDIKEGFEAAVKDVKSAEEMLKSLAESVVNKDFEEIVKLHPNERLAKLFSELKSS
jgi:hypothetical protein